MLNHEVVPLTGASQSHGIRITEEGPYFGMVFAFGALELIGKREDENVQIAFDYELIESPSDTTISRQALETEIGAILSKIMDDSDVTSDLEAAEAEQLESVAHFNETDPVNVELEDGTTVHIETINED